MRSTILAIVALAFSLAVTGCNESAANNSAAKPANAANAANSNSAAASTADKTAVEAEIKKLLDAGAAALAKNDADAMDKIYDGNYMLVNIDGSVQTKAERLAALRSGDTKYTAFSYSDVNIRVKPEGDAAIVIAKLTMKGTLKGKTTDGDYRITQVYGKTPAGWKQISAQATKIEAASEPAKPDDKTKAENKPAANK
jgi:ketosteroid isomerase-like protein